MTTRPRVLIVDDEPLARAHLRSLLEARSDVTVIGECGDGATAVERIRAEGPDLVLLDVQMPELGGFDVVRTIGPERMPVTIFVTAFDQHAVEAFEVHALDYVLKPVNRARFTKAISRVVASLRTGRPNDPKRMAGAVDAQTAGRDRLAVRVGQRVIYLRTGEIDWIEAADDTVRLHCGKQILDHRATMAQMEQRLPSQQFVRIHRSTIVNLERVREFQPWFQGDWILVLADGTKLQSGKSYRTRIRELMEL
ncbi:MAG: LytR/AlgR family response regulator transcription factor [Gemmatimonadota bacterium]